MKRKVLFFSILLLIDFILIHTLLKPALQVKDFAIVALFVYAILFNFLLAGILSRAKKGTYSGVFVINAIAMPLMMYLYT